MKVGKITQLTTHAPTNDLAGVRVAAASVADALSGPSLLARIVRLETRQTDFGERLAALEKTVEKLVRGMKGGR